MSEAIEQPAKQTLVLGGNGKTGSRVLQRLSERGWPVRIGSRSGEPRFDWEDTATWKTALTDIEAVYISFQPDLAVPGAVETIRSFVETAVKTGVRKLVLLSGRGEPEAEECERVVMDSGTDWTILRASWFSQNFSESYLLEPVLAGYVALPVGAIGEPFIDVEDIADVAAAALTEETHNGQLYELTGPRLLTFEEAVNEIAAETGRPIHYEAISMADYASTLAAYGVPGEFVALLKYLFIEVLDGRNASVADGVERALGRKPADFADYVRRTAATGVWGK
ncbi:NAD(P)H-binding protein [Larkinella terrae]|uniref:NAD(P)H-binding protein n=1 Tax=Larkinella terrae TaxID=2025311 RepID=A0A7K0ENJ2_9BACT|nr:NAD(P)H-binding protein [Larkinella terrae]MRS63410.1 NAD(P)H-binding protein [Larkinella terrae]